MDRREFATMVPALLAAVALMPESSAQQAGGLPASAGNMEHPAMGEPTPGPDTGTKPKGVLPEIVSGVYTPGKGYGSLPKRVSHRYLIGMLKAGDIQIEMHETIQEVGALHEPTEKHLHNEIWLVREGLCELTTNGVTRQMKAGDVGICCAGDYHYIRNAGETQCTYFVVTVGPVEAY
jgi:mannose-6-phosphate isomerase-like protein (cupin superfamily)